MLRVSFSKTESPRQQYDYSVYVSNNCSLASYPLDPCIGRRCARPSIDDRIKQGRLPLRDCAYERLEELFFSLWLVDVGPFQSNSVFFNCLSILTNAVSSLCRSSTRARQEVACMFLSLLSWSRETKTTQATASKRTMRRKRTRTKMSFVFEKGQLERNRPSLHLVARMRINPNH